jgi:hypothetical protein
LPELPKALHHPESGSIQSYCLVTNPFLSEFRIVARLLPFTAKPLNFLSRSRQTLFFLAATPALMAVLINAFAIPAGCAIIKFEVAGALLLRTGTKPYSFELNFSRLFGYFPELSHTFFYLILAPAFIIFGGTFIASTWDALSLLQSQRNSKNQRRLGRDEKQRSKGPFSMWGCAPPDALTNEAQRDLYAWIASMNRWFALLLILLPVACLYINASREWRSVKAQENGDKIRLGYIQGPWLDAQSAKLATLSMRQQWDAFPEPFKRSILKSLCDDLPQAINYEFLPPKLREALRWPGVIHPDEATAVDRYKNRNFFIASEAFDAFLDTQTGVLKATVSRGNGGHQLDWHYWTFFTVLVIGESLFHALAGWLLLKALLWLWVVFLLLPGKPRGRYRFTLDYSDDTFRYGLAPIHEPYNWIMAMILLGAFTYFLNQMSNSVKGTGWQQIPTDDALGQLLIFSLYLVPLAVMMLGPISIFDLKVSREKSKAVRALEEANAAPKIIETARSQMTWPRHDKMFNRMLMATLSVVILLNASVLPIPKEAKAILDLSQHIESGVNYVSEYLLKEI